MKRTFLHGTISGILAALAGIIYLNIYQTASEVHFEQIVSIGSISGASIIACLFMSIGYSALIKCNKQRFIGIVNITYAVLSFASIIGAIGMTLPLTIESPELFPGLVVPMHFFPVLAFLTISPFYKQNKF